MGSTISTNKLAAAFKTTSGKTMYVLFEETYESNCYPRTPSWCCLMIGEIASVMRGIFRWAWSCEGGMLKGAGGRDITPEGYVGGWFKQLANPVTFSDRRFDLVAGDSMYATVPKDEFEETKARLTANGFEAEAIRLENGEHLQVSLYEHGELLASIYNGDVGAWRIIQGYNVPTHNDHIPELGYTPEKAKTFTLDTPSCMRLFAEREDVAIKDENGNWRNGGWAYTVIGNYVRDLWEAELREPGSYRARIKHLRKILTDAPIMPAGAVAVIDTRVELPSWSQSSIERVLKEHTHTQVGHEIHVLVTQDTDKSYGLCALSPECTTFVLAPGAAPAAPAQAPQEQLDLIAG